MKAQIVLKKEHFERLRDDARTPYLVNSFIAESVSKHNWLFNYWSDRYNTAISTCMHESYIESINHLVLVESQVEKTKSPPEPVKDNPDYDNQMIKAFKKIYPLIEELPKERQQRVAKALGILYGI